jgi:uncharacterized protein YkwD
MTRGFKHGFLALVLGLGASICAAQAQEWPIDAGTLSRSVIAETNAYRKTRGLPALQTSAVLHAAATSYARFLAEYERVGHTADGKSPAIRVQSRGYRFCYVAENMWGGWQSKPMTVEEVAHKAMDGWKQSPGHNANLLDKHGRDIGVGAAAWKQGDRVIFRVIQVFGDECYGNRFVTRVVAKKTAAKK